MANRGKGHHVLGFDLSKPIKQGILMKQGALHRAFKYRFFVLYPGFLVYFEDQGKWKLDVSRGDTLQSRQGAIKLKNGSCNIARQAPKACKFGLIVHAPDPSNKRPTYLLNAASKEDRDMWIEAIKQGTPHSPKAGRKNGPKSEPTKKEEPAVHAPKYTQRQETVDEAAKVASEEASKNAEESITSIDKELKESDIEPSLSVRRDTTNSAAISLSSLSSNIDSVLEEVEEPVISIDDALGPADSDNMSEADLLDDDKIEELSDELENGECQAEEEVPERKESASSQLATESSVSELKNGKGDMEVVTSVSVICNGGEVGDNKREEDPAGSDDTAETTHTKMEEQPISTEAQSTNDTTTETTEETSGRPGSVEILIPAVDERHHNSFTINSADPDDDDTSDTDDEGDGSSIETGSPPTYESPLNSPTPVITIEPTASTKEAAKENGQVSENEEVKENGVVQENEGVKENDKSEGIKENGEVKIKENGRISNASEDQLSPTAALFAERRPSAAFIQKVGYLYKMGGQRKNWKLRYFVLNPGVFFYYKNPKSTKALGEVKLKNSRVFFPRSGERKTSFQFCVHTESQWNKRQDWVIAAQSEREMKEWIEAFKAAGQKSSPNVSLSGSPSSSRSGSDRES